MNRKTVFAWLNTCTVSHTDEAQYTLIHCTVSSGIWHYTSHFPIYSNKFEWSKLIMVSPYTGKSRTTYYSSDTNPCIYLSIIFALVYVPKFRVVLCQAVYANTMQSTRRTWTTIIPIRGTFWALIANSRLDITDKQANDSLTGSNIFGILIQYDKSV